MRHVDGRARGFGFEPMTVAPYLHLPALVLFGVDFFRDDLTCVIHEPAVGRVASKAHDALGVSGQIPLEQGESRPVLDVDTGNEQHSVVADMTDLHRYCDSVEH